MDAGLGTMETVWRLARLCKFVGVSAFAGGMMGAFFATEPPLRKLAVHRVASPALLVTWGAGYALTTMSGTSMMQAWTLGGLVFSLISQMALVKLASRTTPARSDIVVAAGAFVMVLVFMVFRPTWSMLKGSSHG